MKNQADLLPKEFKHHLHRLATPVIVNWFSHRSKMKKSANFLDRANLMLNLVEKDEISDPEFVWIACKAGIYTGQLYRVLEITWRFTDPRVRIQAAYALAFRGKTAESLELLRVVEPLVEAKEDLELLLELLGIRAFALAVEKRYYEVLGTYYKAKGLTTTNNLEPWQLLAKNRAAYALLKLGYISEATVTNNRVLSVANANNDNYFKALSLIGLGHCVDKINKSDEAIKLYERAFRITSKNHFLLLSSMALNRMGMAYAWSKKSKKTNKWDQEKLEKAVDFFRQAISLAQESHSDWLIFGPMANLALIKKLNGDLYEALELFEGVKDFADDFKRDQLFAFVNLSEIYKELGDKKLARDYKSIAQDLAKTIQSDSFNNNQDPRRRRT